MLRIGPSQALTDWALWGKDFYLMEESGQVEMYLLSNRPTSEAALKKRARARLRSIGVDGKITHVGTIGATRVAFPPNYNGLKKATTLIVEIREVNIDLDIEGCSYRSIVDPTGCLDVVLYG